VCFRTKYLHFSCHVTSSISCYSVFLLLLVDMLFPANAGYCLPYAGFLKDASQIRSWIVCGTRQTVIGTRGKQHVNQQQQEYRITQNEAVNTATKVKIFRSESHNSTAISPASDYLLLPLLLPSYSMLTVYDSTYTVRPHSSLNGTRKKKTEDTNKLTTCILAFKVILILHKTQLATFIKPSGKCQERPL
jgi:hypothetical protein